MDYAYLLLDDGSKELTAVRYEADTASPALARMALDECPVIIPTNLDIMGTSGIWAKISGIMFSNRGDFPGLDTCDPQGRHDESLSDVLADMLYIEREIGWNDRMTDKIDVAPQEREEIIQSATPGGIPRAGFPKP